MEQEKFLHLQTFTDSADNDHGGQDAHCIQDQDLAEDAEQLLKYDPAAADRMRQQVLCCPVLLLAGKQGHTDVRGEESASDPKDIAAFQTVESHQFSEVQAVHAEGLGEAAHGRKCRVELIDLALHIRKYDEADHEKECNGSSPHSK